MYSIYQNTGVRKKRDMVNMEKIKIRGNELVLEAEAKEFGNGGAHVIVPKSWLHSKVEIRKVRLEENKTK